MDVAEILNELGYSFTKYGKYYRAAANFRNGKNRTSLSINSETGKWSDFGSNQSGDINDLIAISLEPKQREEFLKTHKIEIIPQVKKPRIMTEKIYDKECLTRLLPQYQYYLDAGISKATLSLFEAGLAHSGKLNKRIVFPIYNLKRQIVGFAGRWYSKDIPETLPKWKLINRASTFIYPNHLAEINNTVILVESIGNCLRFFNAGIKNVLVLFGTKLSKDLLAYLISKDVKKILICNDNDESGIGKQAAESIMLKLAKYFDEGQLLIKLPKKKDWFEYTEQELKEAFL